jgi:hypothetical protein
MTYSMSIVCRSWRRPIATHSRLATLTLRMAPAFLQTTYRLSTYFLTTNGQERVLEYKDIRTIDNYYPDPDDTTRNASTAPRQWYYYAQTIRTFPVPDQAYTLTLRYYKKPTLLSADADVPSLPSEFEELC